MAKKTGLGKGLDALIPTWEDDSTAAPAGKVLKIPIEQILPNPHQPRIDFNGDALDDLAGSIREHGIIQPLIVVATEAPNQYTLIAGERRLRAAKLAGLQSVPAIVRSATEQEQLEFAIIENVQRENLNAIERAKAYASLINEFALTHDEIARKVGKNRATITNTLRLLSLPARLQQAVESEEISEGHARALLALPSSAGMEAALDTVLSLGLNVRQTELLVSKLSGKEPRKTPAVQKSPETAHLESLLRQHLQTKVSLQHNTKGGSITIYFYSDEELNSLLDNLGIHD